MKLNIELDKETFKSDSMESGRLVARFFESLANNVFQKSYRHFNETKRYTGSGDIPILHSERNIYSVFAAAIDQISPIHLSEWSFNKSDNKSASSGRRVDFWCLDKNGENGKAINYFIEIKKGYYCLNKGSKKGLTKKVGEDIKSLLEQTRSIKRLSPKWDDIDDVYLGISVIHAYYRDGKESYEYSDLKESLLSKLDKRHNAQLIISTWHLPDDLDIQWDDEDKCRFISIVGIAISKKR